MGWKLGSAGAFDVASTRAALCCGQDACRLRSSTKLTPQPMVREHPCFCSGSGSRAVCIQPVHPASFRVCFAGLSRAALVLPVCFLLR